MSSGLILAESSSTAGRWPRRRVLANAPATIAAAVLLLFVVVAVAAPAIAPNQIDKQVGPIYAAPSAAHPLGLDDGGIDVLSLLIFGARVSLIVGFVAALIATVIGGAVGIAAGYFGRWVDIFLMRITDYFLVVPALPLMIIVAFAWGPALSHIVIVIGALGWPVPARVIRAQVRTQKERAYVTRARSLGAGHFRIIKSHIVPHVLPLLLANAVLGIANAIFSETALSFLGLGDPTRVSWGKMIQSGFIRAAISSGAWWAIVPPGVCVILVVMACNVLGQTVGDALNPRLRLAHVARRGWSYTANSTDPAVDPAEGA